MGDEEFEDEEMNEEEAEDDEAVEEENGNGEAEVLEKTDLNLKDLDENRVVNTEISKLDLLVWLLR